MARLEIAEPLTVGHFTLAALDVLTCALSKPISISKYGDGAAVASGRSSRTRLHLRNEDRPANGWLIGADLFLLILGPFL